MASLTLVSGAPKTGKKTAELTTISYEKLLRKDTAEAALLLSACAERGFFYLDLGGSSGEEYRRLVGELFVVSREYFAKPIEEKLKDTEDDEMEVFNICGFKPLGLRGLDAGNVDKKKNGCEHLRVPADSLFNPTSNTRLRCPDGAKNHWGLFSSFIGGSHALANAILASLSDSLGSKDKDRFETHHLSDVPFTSVAALQYYPLTDLPEDTSVGHFAHTDTGSLTVLFNSDWGLQAYSSQDEAWEYVAPHEDCAIINVGDALKFLSGFKLESSLHRVVPWQRGAGSDPRYAAVFFLRPNNDVKLVDGDGGEWTAGEWLKRKFENYRIPHSEQKTNAISTGKKGFTGLLEAASDSESVAEDVLNFQPE